MSAAFDLLLLLPLIFALASRPLQLHPLESPNENPMPTDVMQGRDSFRSPSAPYEVLCVLRALFGEKVSLNHDPAAVR